MRLSGAAAIAEALADAGVRAAYSFPGSPATKVSQALERAGRVRHAWTVNEAVAATMALAGAALRNWGTACIIKHVGTNVALDALATGAQLSEYASPCLLVEGIDARPRTSQNAQDNRPLWSAHARVVALEPGNPDECYALTRWAARLSARSGMPVVVRAEERVLSAEAEVAVEAAATLPAEPPAWQQPVPLISTAKTCGFHVERRARLLAAVELPYALAPGAGPRGYLVAGQMGALAAAGAPTLRLGGCHPLPAARIRGFAHALDELVVVEEGLPLLTEAVRALGLGARVLRGELPPAVPSPPLVRPELPELPASDWASFYAHARAGMPGFAATDPRLALFRALRALARPTLIASDPGTTGVLGIRDGLVDLKLQMGCAAPAAGALADAGVAALPVAVMGDTNFYHSELAGVLDNAMAGREVLHVLVVNRKSEMTAGVRTPYLTDGALDALLCAAGLAVVPDLAAAAGARGPRIVVAHTETEVAADM
ncbi:MAG TPA: thiamine pyrophosphate-binding protein [Polyangia bacterium]|nr:thiamine pyrophosphate-binding protein [Polyangia bacterium]